MRKPVGKRLLPPATVGALPLDSTSLLRCARLSSTLQRQNNLRKNPRSDRNNVTPYKGAPAFRAARRAHAAVESAINNLEQRGRVRARGADGRLRADGRAVGAGGEPAPDRAGAAAAEAEAGNAATGRLAAAPQRDQEAGDLAGARPASGAPARRKRPLGAEAPVIRRENGTESALTRGHAHPYTDLPRARLGPNQRS